MGWGRPLRRVRKAASNIGQKINSVRKNIDNSVKSINMQNVNSALKTTQGIGDDIWTYGKQMGEDIAIAGRNTVENALKPEKLQELFNNPTKYARGVVEPTFGEEGAPGLWDRYGAWTALINPAIYGVGNTLDAYYDYDRTGDIDVLRDRARQTVATVGASLVAPEVYTAAGGGYTGAAAAGAGSGIINTAGRDGAEGGDYLRSAAVGAGAGTLATFLGGSSPIGEEVPGQEHLDPYTGERALQYSVDPATYSLNLGNAAGRAGSMAVHTTNNKLLADERVRKQRNEFERMLTDFRMRQQNRNNSLIQNQAPAFEAAVAGSPLESIFSPEGSTRDQKNQTSFGGSGFGLGNSQVSSARDNTYDGQSGVTRYLGV